MSVPSNRVAVPQDIRVIRVRATSRAGGTPDRVVNQLFQTEGLMPLNGQQRDLYSGGVVPTESQMRIHITNLGTPSAPDNMYRLFLKKVGADEVLLAEGKLTSAGQDGAFIAMKGNCLPTCKWGQISEIVFYCVATVSGKAPAGSVPTGGSPASSSSAKIKIGYRFVGVAEISVDTIHPLVGQPRKYFHPGKLRELANSIKEIGLQQLIQVRQILPHEPEYKDGYRYMLVDGERRLRAHKLIEKSTIGANIVEVDSSVNHYCRSLVLNFHHEGHSHYEIALAVIELTRAYNENAAAVARDLGKSPAWVSGYLRLKTLDQELFKLLNPEVGEANQLRLSHAVLLAGIKPEEQMRVYQEMLSKQSKGVRHMTDFLKSEAVTHSSGTTTKGRTKQKARPSKLARSVVRGLQHMEHTVHRFVEDIANVSNVLDGSKQITREDLVATIDKVVAELILLRDGVAATPNTEKT